MKDKLRDAVMRVFERLVREDGNLFNRPIEKHASDYDARKLHEVCLNHRLANYLEAELLPLLVEERGRMFVDIEFNREGVDFKNLKVHGQEKVVRPDIIVHNRKTGANKDNFLVIECKRNDASMENIAEDREKINAFMKDKRYEYSFGLQVLYAKDQVCGYLLFKRNGRLCTDVIDYSKPTV